MARLGNKVWVEVIGLGTWGRPKVLKSPVLYRLNKQWPLLNSASSAQLVFFVSSETTNFKRELR